ncbi:Tol-Pal system beta propeller repeat protein TolB [Asticcacaulis excentricus]|uniref:Tol-Pal system protein TolB n=1 Tax=Asticcacaulis excentricus (strain ATCC 15261 / DSM 4724 / KCTC 12464 / NCIMB 9791 / VKM B-1370 / CB 48) TaxID=573065 RepID=E8RR28_ASTEC|nr:Tol-Pal system beta propeller repeat protein TolB [Asticcacaulis excentricus]ADU13346.1 Tol-Pal system beta propeller repeat protein TolB [Asticcacaulis excentricus CB 48]
MKPFKIAAVAFATFLALTGAPLAAFAQAPIRAEVAEGVIAPMPIAIDIESSGSDLGDKITRVVMADLERSGFFKPIDPNAFIEQSVGIDATPTFASWKTINAQALANGAARVDGEGRLQVDFRLWDVFSEKQLLGQSVTATPENWRRIAHKIADAIYEKLTGEEGYFDTRIVFVAESGARGKRVKRLAIMDQDGANPSYLTDGSYKVMTPRFSADSQEVAYMVLREDSARIYVFNIETGRQEAVGQIKGMVFAPRFSPDGSKLAYSVAQGGNTDIYVMDLRTRATRRVTTDPGIDTSPSFSPDGSTIVFNSDRGGSPQLYAMNADGSGVRRISFGGGIYSTPVFSPKGDKIAFTKQSGGRFSIGVMDAGGGNEKLLTSSFLEEGPTWAPNGRYIMFFREPPGALPSLWMVEASGRIERQVPYSGGASDPAWSPRLK